MKKRLLIILTILICQLLFSQEKKTGSVVYVASIDVSILGNYAVKAPKKLNKQISETLNNIKDVNYLLTFTNEQSKFVIENKLENENKKRIMNLTKIKAGKGQYFFNIVNNEILHQKNSFGQQFLISMPPMKWEITSENKMLGKYLCYKATTEKYIESRRGKKAIKIEAWYAPEIPFNYGPKNYNGLPGLILNLKEGALLFYAKNIKIKSKETIKIKVPTKGKRIKLEEYDKW
jgi:GLPGLI family protein